MRNRKVGQNFLGLLNNFSSVRLRIKYMLEGQVDCFANHRALQTSLQTAAFTEVHDLAKW